MSITTNYYMYGMHSIFSAIDNKDRIIEKVYCIPKHEDIFRKKCNLRKRKLEIVDHNFITNKIGHNKPHQGVIALVDTIFKNDINHLDFDKNEKIIILDQLSDPQNIGNIIRSAIAFGIQKIILPKNNCPKENGVIAKAASGTLESADIFQVSNIRNTINKLKKIGFWVAGLSLNGEDNITSLSKFEKLAIIIGSEGNGIRSLIEKNCDLLVKIPMNIESINVSNATSIVLHSLASR